MEQLLMNYLKSFKIHVATKTVDKVLHDFLADVYELLFDILHTVSEKRQDLGIDAKIDCDKAVMSMITLLESEKSILEGMVKEKNSIGMDDLLRSHVNSLESLIGTAKGFQEKEEEYKEETSKVMKSGLQLK